MNESTERPAVVRLEACTLCQLNCVDCYMRKSTLPVKLGYLKWDDFVRFLEMNPFVREIELANSGEVFLNPDLLKIIEYAGRMGVQLTANSGVNFNTVSDEMLEALVKFRFTSILVSIDGASQEVYSKYRINGNFDKVISNIKKLNNYKEKYNSIFPILKWQYILLESNDSEDEILKAIEMSASLKMTIIFKNDWGGYKSKHAGILENKGYKSFAGKDNKNMWCSQLWNTPQINWDGSLLGCCVNYKKAFPTGNVFEIGLEACLNHSIVNNTKRMLTGGEQDETSPCINCSSYKKMVKSGQFVNQADFSTHRVFDILRQKITIKKQE